MKQLDKQLENRKIDYDKIILYGFKKDKDLYSYQRSILNNEFVICIEIKNNTMFSKVIEVAFNEEYVLATIEKSTGEFVGKIKEEYEKTINDIIEKCTYKDIFQNKQSKRVIEYIKKYNTNLEFLWERSPKTAVIRNNENDKWYGIIFRLPSNKLGLKSNEEIEIIDLRYQKDIIDRLIDNKTIFRGYHMNKKSWITIILNNNIKDDKLFSLIDNSYNLSKK